LVKLDKIYTRGGDKGFTSLGDGKRVKKNNIRIKAYGEIDELNCALGIARIYCSKSLESVLLKIQNQLFDIGADLCVPKKRVDGILVKFESIELLEAEIDKLNSKLPSLKSFIIPGGSKSSAFLHLSRSIARRCERSIIDLEKKETVSSNVVKYMNRLSDFLFVAARFENKKDGDILWIPNKE